MRTNVKKTLGTLGTAALLTGGALAFPTSAFAGPIGECDPGTSQITTSYQSSNQEPAGSDRTTNPGPGVQTLDVSVSSTKSTAATTSAEVGFSVEAIAASVNATLGYSVTTSQAWESGTVLKSQELQPGQSVIAEYGFETLTVMATQQNCDSTGTWQNGESTLATLPQGVYKTFTVE
ncbi:hypothetical protein CLV49_1373 [Labedella gwakjiensis]|uniref:Uncharacterized protein n=1 Tax=Labedella gwakjiensis TaxID=390269 RepID=A0A2P8GUY3_9MICO|nr:hypothetical protein [Labedella gwakjiensis]PSL37766.1 hypothetical protein CLV49_1373 [Labedella gwakjiensis]